ncbi:MAG: M20 family metallo-hydrolase [Tissierellia bacterium]|nr:M20 family metallo-hydrolase [Tissierellia bacterium]
MISIADLMNSIDGYEADIRSDVVALCSIPGVNPKMNGDGEYQRFQWLSARLEDMDIPYKLYGIADKSVNEGIRQNLVVKLKGEESTDRTLWFIAHMDTVNTGDLTSWRTNPFEATVDGDRIYGLGVEDNGQAIIAMLYLIKLMRDKRLRTKTNIGFMFVSDEETGSDFGIKHLLSLGLVGESDEAVVPDGGSPIGDFIEIAEKSQLWIKFTILGKQVHASMPQLGLNACSIGMHLGVEIEDSLKRVFSMRDEIFNPPISTIELTQKFSNVDSPNILPGKDEFVMDLRILPSYSVSTVEEEINRIIEKYLAKHPGIEISYNFISKVEAPSATDPESKVVKTLVRAIEKVGIEAHYGGIGGGTCAAILRKENIPAVVWSKLDELAHQSNEYVIIPNLINDIKVFTHMILEYD